MGILQNQFPGLAMWDSHALFSGEGCLLPGWAQGPGEEQRKCVGLGLGWELVGSLLEQAPSQAQRAHCCWAQPGQALKSGHHGRVSRSV